MLFVFTFFPFVHFKFNFEEVSTYFFLHIKPCVDTMERHVVKVEMLPALVSAPVKHSDTHVLGGRGGLSRQKE